MTPQRSVPQLFTDEVEEPFNPLQIWIGSQAGKSTSVDRAQNAPRVIYHADQSRQVGVAEVPRGVQKRVQFASARTPVQIPTATVGLLMYFFIDS